MFPLLLKFVLTLFIISNFFICCDNVKKRDFPKCCGIDEIVTKKEKDKLMCSPNLNKTLYLITNHENDNLFRNCNGDRECIDVHNGDVIKSDCKIRNVSKHIMQPTFHKCCPLNYSYEIGEHKCVRDEREDDKFSKGTHLIYVGLHKCKGLVQDYIFENMREADLYIRKDSMHNFDSYCVDNVIFNNMFVLRICHDDLSLCRKSGNENKIKCIRKCCADGHMFKDNTNCVPTFSHGVNLSLPNVHQSDGE